MRDEWEPPETPEISPPPLPGATEAARPFLDTGVGAIALVLGGLVAWFVLTQFLPGLAIGIYVVATRGKEVLSGPALEAALVPYIPTIVFAAMVMSAVLVVSVRMAGWLAPKPTSVTPWWMRPVWVVFAAAACLVGSWCIAILQGLLGFEATEQDLIVQAATSNGGLWLMLALAVAAPIGEELVFRRFMFSSVVRGMGRPSAYAISAVLFGVAHLHPPAFLLYVWMGLCFAFAYERSGSVWGAIAVHAANNAVALLFL